MNQLQDQHGKTLPDGWIRVQDEEGRLAYKNMDDGRMVWYNSNDTVVQPELVPKLPVTVSLTPSKMTSRFSDLVRGKLFSI